MDKRTIGIVCNFYAGSTALGAILGAHSGIFNAGELTALWNKNDPTRIPGKRCSICRVAGVPCHFWDTVDPDKIEVAPGLHDSVREILGQRIILDSSKRPDWFENFSPGPEWVLIHLVKSPLELAASYKMRNEKARLTPEKAAALWVKINRDAISLVNGSKDRGAAAVCISYRNFATDYRKVIPLLMQELGLEVEEAQYRYFEISQHFIGGNSYPVSDFVDGHIPTMPEAFNVDRYKTKNRRSIFYDDKWKTVLTRGEMEAVYRTPGVSELARELNVTDTF